MLSGVAPDCAETTPVAQLAAMDAAALVATAASLSFLAGWRVYACVFATGIAMHFGWFALPAHLHALDVFASPWVIGAAGLAMIGEFFADKIAWLDTAWDAVHTAIRPVGGALLALAIVDPADPKWQLVSVLLGGSAALISHSAKAGTRAAVNASPEPVSNIVVSSSEDVTATSLLMLAVLSPTAAAVVALVVAAGSIALLLVVRRVFARLLGGRDGQPKSSARK